MFARLLSAVCIVGAASLLFPQAACGQCSGSDVPLLSELPLVKCQPPPAGSGAADGCVGLPHAADASSQPVYPLGCRVDVADHYATCGYSEFDCAYDGKGGYSWENPL